jgi:DUF971 family protein
MAEHKRVVRGLSNTESGSGATITVSGTLAVAHRVRLPTAVARAKHHPLPMTGIQDIQLIGDLVAIRWADASETYHRMDRLRSLSPSAETSGERDLLGRELVATDKGRDFTGVTVLAWSLVGNYAIQFRFSDGHNTGLYSFEYLREIADEP